MVYIHYEGPRRVIRARELRKNMTPAEQIIWANVRNRHLGGFKIRRQEIINEMIVDFYCSEKRLCIEIDGPYHFDPDQQIADRIRDQELHDHGYKILRFTNDEVLIDTELVLEKILAKLRNS
jgi:very-short-patch-repair endonuclease